MSKGSRKRKRFNSDLDSLRLYDIEECAAETGPTPYDCEFDYGPNGVRYVMECLELIDNNQFIAGPDEPYSFFEVYKL